MYILCCVLGLCSRMDGHKANFVHLRADKKRRTASVFVRVLPCFAFLIVLYSYGVIIGM